MDFLVLSCGTGGGHDAAARNLAGTMTLRGHRAVILNPYTLHSFQLAGKIDRAYVNLVQKAPSVFGAVYAAGAFPFAGVLCQPSDGRDFGRIPGKEPL